MKIEFLGHGLHNSAINTVGDWLCSTFKDKDYSSFIGFSAFTKMSGINRIREELMIAKQNYKRLKFVLGIVERGTSKEALQFLIDSEIETWVYCADNKIMFHPKIYYFSGKHNSRFILGSSNLTGAGLFDNIEASTLFEFSNRDATGNKFIRQFSNYFNSILDGKHDDLQLLTSDVLQDLIDSGFVVDENKTKDDFDYNKNKELFSKRKKLKIDKDEIGNQTSILNPHNHASSHKLPDIESKDYLNWWEEMFALFLEHKNEFSDRGERFSVTVSRDYKIYSLYRWYRIQKVLFKENKLPENHKKRLENEKFYFKDAHKLWQEYLEEQKLEILLEALIAGENVKANHRYSFKGHRIGTWLVGVSQANRKGKKLELRKQIKDLGFDFTATSRNPIDTAKRFVSDLLNSENPDKANFQNRFNSVIRERLDEIPEDIQQDIVDSWFLQFDEERPLGKIRERQKDRTSEWKEFRYNNPDNTEGKWFGTFNQMGDLYSWVRQKRETKSRMDLVKHHFSTKEKSELRLEGFPI
ncbi:phospholipase D family protein [Maribellus maritimus]|uniref:phospholipase D family protein n=1 Tax=Maribellus maritimus TaxID=2870838 RepID=UPI001EEA6E43|nr:phospholipase D family protein [Maribellus maritimus]MCG6191401.1 phospholipase D family protein [Maribellus maritimus]